MRGLARFLRRLWGGSRALEREVDAEIAGHLEMRIEELVRRGIPLEQARTEAVRRFGDPVRARRELHASARRRQMQLGWRRWLDSLKQDAKLAQRRIREAPAFAALAVATFGLGIGLTTATFTVVKGVLLSALPFPEPERLVALRSVDSEGWAFPWVSMANWLDWKEQSRALAATALYYPGRTEVVTDDDAFRVPRARVVGPFFEVLQAPMLVGRPFTEDDAQADAAVAVVSEGFWRRVMGSDPELGRELRIAGRQVSVVGVIPAGLEHPAGAEVWLPFRYIRRTGTRNNINWFAIGRLAPDASIDQARTELDAIARGIRTADPTALYSWGVGVVGLQDEVVDDADNYLGLLMGAVGFVLLVACANLAGLGFARTSARRSETAVRIALGAGRSRIVQQLVTEQVALALLGGGLGTLLAWRGTALLLDRAGGRIPRAHEIGVDPWVLAFGIGVSLLAGVLAGVAPAIRASTAAPREAVGSARGAVGGHRRTGTLLVGCEVALTVLLLVGGGLLVRSFISLVGRELGFEPRGVVIADIALSSAEYRGEPQRQIAFWDSLLESLRSIPGVEAAAAASPIPTGEGGRGFVEIAERPDVEAAAAYRVVTEDYFRSVEIPLIEGRMFDGRDGAATERVTIINRRMAETYWPGESALGKRFRATSMESPAGAPWLTVIGVVRDTRYWGFDSELQTAHYVLHRQVPGRAGAMSVAVRGPEAATGRIASELRERLRAIDPEIAADVDTLQARVGQLVSRERLIMSVLTTFAALALALAAIGIYGLQSFGVVQRTREIAVRTALGARRRTILGMILGSAVRVATVGAAVGLVAAFWLAEMMAALLVEIGPRDPATFAAVAGTILVVALLAAALPAWRAVRLDPLEALRKT